MATTNASRGTLQVYTPRPWVLLFAVEGKADLEVAEAIITWTNKMLAGNNRPHVFHDWEHMTGYDSNAREQLTAYVDGVKKQLGSANMLVKSKIVAMGVAVANALLGGTLHGFSERARFEETLQRVLSKEP